MWGMKVLCLACILVQVLEKLVLVTEWDISVLKLFSFIDDIGIGIDIGFGFENFWVSSHSVCFFC